jgi:hypothetical protein
MVKKKVPRRNFRGRITWEVRVEDLGEISLLLSSEVALASPKRTGNRAVGP